MLQLHVPCILFGVRMRKSALAADIAAHLDFSPTVHALANKVIGVNQAEADAPNPLLQQSART